MAAIGFSELIVLLGLSGGLGLPLGIPPAAEDPLLARVAPEECLFYTTWTGLAEPDPKSPNQTEQLLAEPEVQQFVREIESKVRAAVRKAAERQGPQGEKLADDAAEWVKMVLTRPTALYVGSVKMTATVPDIRAGAIVAVGEDAAKLKATLEGYQQMALGRLPQSPVKPVQINGETWYRIQADPQAPPITWGVRGRYLIIGVGDGSVESILERAKAAPPAWLTKVRQQLPVDRVSQVSYLNVKAILANLAPLAAGPRPLAVIEAFGLGNIDSFCSVTGLDREGFVSRTLVGLRGEPQGLLTVLAGKPLAAPDLAPIPADATLAMAARLDVGQTMETVIAAVEKLEPRAREEINRELGRMEEVLGFKLREDLLGSLGDTWRVYNAPSEGGLVVTGLTAVVDVKDARRLAGVNEKLIAAMKAEMERRGEDARTPRIEQFQFAGQNVYFFNARDNDMPLAPAWCIRDKELIVATMPQNIKAYLSRPPRAPSLATVPAMASALRPNEAPVALSYLDVPKVFDLVYPLVPMFAQVIMSNLQREGIDVNVSILPSAAAIRKHLRPAVTVVRRTPAGIEIHNRQSLPGGSIGATAPIGAAVMLPAIRSARGAARRTVSMNNMKQIGLAMHNYAAANIKFPPAYISSKDGKPLLSWRVAVLPYLEGQPLYEQFKMDEPWDSEHNKKLIEQMPAVYRSPASMAPAGYTNYLTVRGKDTVFPGKEGVGMAAIVDGTSNTIMTVEVNDEKAVPWTKPDDFEPNEQNPKAGLLGLWPGGIIVGFCDGSVRWLSDGISSETLKLLFSRNDGKPIDQEELYRPSARPSPFGSKAAPKTEMKKVEARAEKAAPF